MNNIQFLLVKLAEEANEVAVRALKASQFGLDEVQPDQSLSNAERLAAEVVDLQGILALLKKEAGLDLAITDNSIRAKIEKVVRYREYARSLGLVE